MHSRARDSRHLVAKRLRSHAEVHIRIIRKELFIEFDLFEDFSSNKSISYEVEVRWPARSAHPGRPSCPHIYATADEIRFASRIPELLRADDTTISLALQMPEDRKSTRLNSSHSLLARMPSSA